LQQHNANHEPSVLKMPARPQTQTQARSQRDAPTVNVVDMAGNTSDATEEADADEAGSVNEAAGEEDEDEEDDEEDEGEDEEVQGESCVSHWLKYVDKLFRQMSMKK
jgi:hypothetical protein